MRRLARIAFVIVAVCSAELRGDVSIELVTVGDPGNVGESSGGRIVGSVNNVYQMGQFEITNGQYVEFLNSVAKSDPYGLSEGLAFNGAGQRNAGIERTGTDGEYQYSLMDGDENWRNRPVAGVSLWQAMRFANWLHNGQLAGEQNAVTTEDGSYSLNGYNGRGEQIPLISRNPGATWVVPTEDEWYKAAYYDGAAQTYYDYPTSSNELPSHQIIDPDPGNNANAESLDDEMSLGPPYFVTEVGEFENSTSPYGTFDQGGNLWEWTETIVQFENGVYQRVVRGGSYGDDDGSDLRNLASSFYSDESPGVHDFNDGTPGFRVALVPEPASCSMLLIVILMTMARFRSLSRLKANDRWAPMNNASELTTLGGTKSSLKWSKLQETVGARWIGRTDHGRLNRVLRLFRSE